MRTIPDALAAHLAIGATKLCRCWRLNRADGGVLGFTDHDRDITFGGTVFRASTGLDAAALHQTTGLSVDNSTAVGALSDLGLDDADIRAGAYDGAEILAWLVNWSDPGQRLLQFRGTIGEIRRAGAFFEAELRGLSENLNQPVGRAYHKNCSAVLGDQKCDFVIDQPGYFAELTLGAIDRQGHFSFSDTASFDERWFAKGVLRMLSGPAKGLAGIVRRDRMVGGVRQIELWQELSVSPQPGDLVRLEAGCDRRAETCRLKFHNFPNFRGFPDIPGEDWAMTYPTRAALNDGGSLR